MSSMDTLLDPMEETRFKKKHSTLFAKLARKSHFNLAEMESLMIIFYKIKKDGGDMKSPGISKSQFRDVLHSGFDMTDDTLMDRIFTALEAGPNPHPSAISMETWARSMSLFLRGTLEEKIDHCFNVYNLMGDGMIGRESMFNLLRNSLISSGSDDDAEELVKDLIELLTKKMDLDRDGKISYNDYKQSVIGQPMLLECFGQCLPSRMAAYAYSTSVLPHVGKL